MSQNFAAKIDFDYGSLEDAFPTIDAGIEPLGSRVLVQIRRAKRKTAGGIVLPDEVRDTESANTQVARVIGKGPLAFKNREKGTPWVEGAWVDVGDYVRVPKYGGDRFTVDHEGDEITCVIFNDLDMIARVTADPRRVKSFI